ncbi:MAG: short-chain dehydrogenase/reductase [Hyphomicrobiales bacterium]|nr:short-chain dehydrogenase/reductase [Hyphomicrobiales bacterium]
MLKGQVAIVTGASVGLGRAMAFALAEAGACVALASPQTSLLEEAAAQINARCGERRAIAVTTDITQQADCERARDATLQAFGDISILVNNARREQRGPGLPTEGNNFAFWESDPAIWMQAVNVNVSGTFLMTRTVAPHLIARGWGRIVNISTSLDTMQRRHNSPYGVTKAALDAASLIWAADLAGTGVTCNILLPGGMVDTDGTRPSTPQRRTLNVDVMNAALLWLASPESDGHTAERYNGSRWRMDLPATEAARAALEAPVLRTPEPRG